MERSQKVAVHAGITSRRKAGEFILIGRVKVSGQVVRELGIKVRKHDAVEVDEVPIYQEEYDYYLLYKPERVISAIADDKGGKTVADLLPIVKERVYPIGRLGYDASGILLLTNDGNFTQRLTHPKHEVDKVCIVEAEGIAARSILVPLTRRVKVEGRKMSPAELQVLSMDPKTNHSIVELTIYEGRNHQVKSML